MRPLYIVGLIMSLSLASCAPIPPPVLSPFADQSHWVLIDSLEVDLYDTGNTITIPKGFVTDFASIPKAFCQLFGSHGQYSRAALLHDYLYWSQGCTRAQADALFLQAMVESDVKLVDRTIIYEAVRRAGQIAWDSNAEDRQNGLPRVIPSEYLPIPDTAIWREFRVELQAAGVVLDGIPNSPSYCGGGPAR